MCEQVLSDQQGGQLVSSPTGPVDDVRRRVYAEARAAHQARILARLFERRPDLRGVHPPADHAYEAFRWSA